MKKWVSVGLVLVMALVLGVPALFAQQQAPQGQQQQQMVQCPRMGQGGMRHGYGRGQGMGAQGANCPRMKDCPMANKPDCPMYGKSSPQPGSGQAAPEPSKQ